MRCFCQTAPKPRTGRVLGYVAQTEFRGRLVHPQPPTFCGFQASHSPNETPRSPYRWSLGGAGGQPGPRTVGANGGWVHLGRKKKDFFQSCSETTWDAQRSVVTHFGPWKIPKCLENGLFSNQKWVKNGSKTHCSKSDPGPLGRLKQVFLAHFEPLVMRFGPWKIPKCLKKCPF